MEGKELPAPLTTAEMVREFIDGKTSTVVLDVSEQTDSPEPECPFKVGDAVYMYGSPVQCGVIVAMEQNGKYFRTVSIRGLKKNWSCSTAELMDFRRLVADHKRKYEKFKAVLDELGVEE